MRFLFTILFTCLVASRVCYADYATKTEIEAVKCFLDQNGAVAISHSDICLDGGSLLYRLSSDNGQRFDFVLATPRRRTSIDEVLCVTKKALIVSKQDRDIISPLLIVKLEAGISSGLQGKWPLFELEARALIELLRRGGYDHDLDTFKILGISRMERTRPERADYKPNGSTPAR